MSKEHVNLILIGWALVVCGENFENAREINQTQTLRSHLSTI